MDYERSLKQEYNGFLIRHHRACVYFDDNCVPWSKREEWFPELKIILENLNRILKILEEHSIKYTVNEVLDGFDLSEKKGG